MADANPVTLIIAELLRRLGERPFEPFTVVMTNGSRHHVPTPDHCTVTRLLRRIEIEHDNGDFAIINPLHISQIELQHRPAA